MQEMEAGRFSRARIRLAQASYASRCAGPISKNPEVAAKLERHAHAHWRALEGKPVSGVPPRTPRDIALQKLSSVIALLRASPDSAELRAQAFAFAQDAGVSIDALIEDTQRYSQGRSANWDNRLRLSLERLARLYPELRACHATFKRSPDKKAVLPEVRAALALIAAPR